MSAQKNTDIIFFLFKLFSLLTKLTLVTWIFFGPYISSEKELSLSLCEFPLSFYIVTTQNQNLGVWMPTLSHEPHRNKYKLKWWTKAGTNLLWAPSFEKQKTFFFVKIFFVKTIAAMLVLRLLEHASKQQAMVHHWWEKFALNFRNFQQKPTWLGQSCIHSFLGVLAKESRQPSMTSRRALRIISSTFKNRKPFSPFYL